MEILYLEKKSSVPPPKQNKTPNKEIENEKFKKNENHQLNLSLNLLQKINLL